MSIRRCLCLAVPSLALLAPTPVFAESPPDRTGTGGGPLSTITAPHTSSVGKTKPPGPGIGLETPAERRELDAIRREDDAIDDSICVDCGRR